jgi:inosine-uridine nucleoside N-ribohydrolase
MGNENRFVVHDALAVGILCWPELFMQARMELEMIVSGEQAGRCKPKVPSKRQRSMHVVISIHAVDFLENLMEELCHEKFVV